MGELETKFRARAPKLRARDVEEINGLFPAYFFRRKSTGEVWTTCCRRYAVLEPEAALWQAPHVSEEVYRRGHWLDLHNKQRCPFCGQLGTVKDLKYTGRRENLTAWRRFALLRWDGKALWAECFEAKKEYGYLDLLTSAPVAKAYSLYRFGKDAVECVIDQYGRGSGSLETHRYAELGKRTVDHPFWISTEGRDYRVIGLDALEKSPVRYCRGEVWARRQSEIVKFLHTAYAYPRQVELLMKAGMEQVVFDLAVRGVRHCAVLDWTAEPKRAFRVPPEVVKEFLALDPSARDIAKLELWKSLNRKGKVSLREVLEAWLILGDKSRMAFARKWGAEPMRLWRYLDGQNHCMPGQMWAAWRDYVEAGQAIGLNLYRDDVLFPKDLSAAHDDAVERRRRKQQAEWERQNRERQRERAREARRVKANEEQYAEYRKKLEKRYGWEAEGFRITVPRDKEEIVREGIELKHCVGGYADRHIQRKTVILFMRKVRRPDTPWLTIEMNGTELVQIHGYKNEGAYSAKRIAPDPREVYRAFLDRWLAWVAAGSRRKKDGTPIEAKERIAAGPQVPGNDEKGDAA